MIRSLITKIPVRISMPFVLTLPVLGVVLVLSFLAFIQGRTTVNDLLAQNLDQIHLQITKQLDDLLKLPGRINHINAHLISQHKLDFSDIREWRRTFFEQMQAFDRLSSIAWGGSNGQAVWVVRSPNESGYVFAIKDGHTGEEIHEYQLDPNGNIYGKRSGAYKYDPRIRPWYKAAITAGKPTWTKIYAWLSKDGTESTLGIGFVQPIRDKAEKILGVIDAELSLYDISWFLDNLRVGKTGLAFVMDRKGRLIATSTSVPVTDLENKPLFASESSNRVVSSAGMYLNGAFKSLEDITIPSFQ